MGGPSLRPTHWIGLVSMGKLPVTTQGPISIIRHSMLLVFLFISISNSLLLLLRYAIYQIAEEDKLKGGNVVYVFFVPNFETLLFSPYTLVTL